jgi:phage shock protein C
MTMDAGSEERRRPDEEPVRPVTRLYRSRTDRVVAGVCAGVAEYLGADATLVRLATVLLVLVTGLVPGLVLYLVAAILVPEGPAGDPVPVRPAGAARGDAGLVLGLVLVGIGVLVLVNRVLRVDWDALWPLALIALGLTLILAAQRR